MFTNYYRNITYQRARHDPIIHIRVKTEAYNERENYFFFIFFSRLMNNACRLQRGHFTHNNRVCICYLKRRTRNSIYLKKIHYNLSINDKSQSISRHLFKKHIILTCEFYV